jgi:4-nitrophenyl phosphatase
MINALTPKISGMILDMDGVLWVGNKPLGDLQAIFNKIKVAGITVVLATNNSTKSVSYYQDIIKGYKVDLDSSQIINSAMAAGFWLTQKFPTGGPIHILGESGLVNTLKDFGFEHTDEEPLAVVVGMDREVTYNKIAQASKFIREGAIFIGTNPDKTFPTLSGLAPGAGAIVAAVEAACGVSPIIMGKPQTALFEIALQRIKQPANQVLVVGDRLDTDILGGRRSGCRTALVLSGANSKSDLEDCPYQPDLVAADLSSLLAWE